MCASTRTHQSPLLRACSEYPGCDLAQRSSCLARARQSSKVRAPQTSSRSTLHAEESNVATIRALISVIPIHPTSRSERSAESRFPQATMVAESKRAEMGRERFNGGGAPTDGQLRCAAALRLRGTAPGSRRERHAASAPAMVVARVGSASWQWTTRQIGSCNGLWTPRCRCRKVRVALARLLYICGVWMEELSRRALCAVPHTHM